MWINRGNGGRSEQVPFMKVMTSCVNEAVTEGYTECFKVTDRGLYAISRSRYYRPEQVRLINTCRFEAQRTTDDCATMYLIETSDGLKGTLVDGYAALAERSVIRFMTEVEDIYKRVARHDQHEC